MTDTTCPICSGPAHDETYRCETCGAEFSCPSAFFKMPTAVAEITAHRSRPVIGLTTTPEGGVWPTLGDEVTCGPVLPASQVAPSKTQRGFATAQAQQRRSGLRVVGGGEK